MSDGSTQGQRDDPARRAAQADQSAHRDAADTAPNRREEAQNERETVRDTAISASAQRDAAELVTRNQAYLRQEAEAAAAFSARLRADQTGFETEESEEEDSLLHDHLVTERKAASNATFGLTIGSVLLMIGLIAGSAFYFSSQNSSANNASAGVTPGAVAAATWPAKSSDVSAPDRMPATINVNPAPAVNVTSEGSADSVVSPANAAISGNGANDLTRTNSAADAGNIAGSAIAGDADKPTAGSVANTGGGANLPEGNVGAGTESKIANP